MNGLPIVVGVVVENDASTAPAFEYDAVPYFSNDIVLNFVTAVPMIKFYAVVLAAIVAGTIMMIVAPILISVTELSPDVRGA